MKKYLAVLVIVALGSVAPVFGLNFLRVTVPFDFVVGKTTLPAGEYVIEPMGGYQTVILVRQTEGRGSVFTLSNEAVRHQIPEVTATWASGPAAGSDTMPYTGNNPTKATATGENCLIFNRYGDQYFISKMWIGLQGREFLVGPIERQLKTAGLSNGPETVLLAATVH